MRPVTAQLLVRDLCYRLLREKGYASSTTECTHTDQFKLMVRSFEFAWLLYYKGLAGRFPLDRYHRYQNSFVYSGIDG